MDNNRSKLEAELEKFVGGNTGRTANQTQSTEGDSNSLQKRGCFGCILKITVLLIVGFLILVVIGILTPEDEIGKNGENAQQDNVGIIEPAELQNGGDDSLPPASNPDGVQPSREKQRNDKGEFLFFEEIHAPRDMVLTQDIIFRDEEHMDFEIKKGSKVKFVGINNAGVVTIMFNSERYIRHNSVLEGKLEVTP